MKRPSVSMKQLTFLLIAALILFSLPIYALAQETDDGFQYQVGKDGNVTITGYSGTSLNIDVPSTIEGLSVTALGTGAFSNCNKVESIKLPISLLEIGEGIFVGDNALEKIVIPKAVTKIAQDIFEDCGKITIWGLFGSAAEKYANKNNIPFIMIMPVKDVQLSLDGYNVSKRIRYINLASDINTLELSAKTSPESPWPDVTWKSSNAKVASVDSNGLVAGLKKGKTTITATAVDGSGIKASCEIIVANLVKEITITGEPTVAAGKKITLSASVLPNIADNKKVTWKSSNDNIATINSKGVVTAKKIKKEKTVTITATAMDGSKVHAQYQIKVTP